jgi:hypothetical protein
MRTIRAIFRAGILEPLEPVDLPEDTTLTLALLEQDDLPASGIGQAALDSGAFDFLSDPREDRYSPSDGEAV